jgi:hypothetical protein
MVNPPPRAAPADTAKIDCIGLPMAWFKFLDTSGVEQFATELAEDLGRRFPPAAEARTDAGRHHQLKVIMDGLALRAVQYREQNQLGMYRKAKLGNSFRWKLTSLGYSDDFVERATSDIVTRLAQK